ncbi:trypsin-1 isoform X2 [Cherax quadricarinatus]|uniref:trypsin-1 isoform X2 n=1 Tax=Cherax quadricarinatus TaxID=27406 RepID=UPI00387E3786
MVMRLVPGVVVCVALLLLLTFVYPASPQHRNSACVDSSKECPAWATQGRCRTHPKFLQLVCPLSCNACVECGRGDVFKTSSRSTSTSRNTSRRRNSSRNKSSRRNTGNKSSSSSRGRRVRQIIFPDKLLELRAAAAAAASRNTRPVDDSSPVTENSTAAVMVTDAFCGATVVSDRFLVTAAHCIFDLNHPLNAVRLGELDFSSDNENNSAPVDYDVQEIIVHPQYDPESRVRYNDIAMIKTVEKITYNEFVFPYCLVRERPKPKTLVTGAGFGLINATHQSPILQEAELKVVGTAECENIYKNEDYEPQLRLLYPNLLESQDIICASFPNRSACQGDSGGPLFLDDDEGRRFLVGIVGAGVSCRGSGVSRLPGLFISIADHIPFINSVLFEDLGTE